MWILATAYMMIATGGSFIYCIKKGVSGPALIFVIGWNSLWLRIDLIVCFPTMYVGINET
jgi:hypothetical protein